MTTRTGILLPPRTRLEPTGSGLVLVLRWFTPAMLLLVALALFGDVLVGATLLSLDGRSTDLKTALGLGVLTLAVLCMTYLALMWLLNRSRIVLDAERLAVTHGPIPGLRPLSVERSRVLHVYCQELLSPSANPAQYQVRLVLREGPELVLARRWVDRQQGQYVAQQLARAMGLPEHSLRSEVVGLARS